MPIFSWIRDLFGIQKDMYETKKTRLEIDDIERKERERLITPATVEDVKKYDPKTQHLIAKINRAALNVVLILCGFTASGYFILRLFLPDVLVAVTSRIRELLGW